MARLEITDEFLVLCRHVSKLERLASETEGLAVVTPVVILR